MVVRCGSGKTKCGSGGEMAVALVRYGNAEKIEEA